jgi:hypothetical protein
MIQAKYVGIAAEDVEAPLSGLNGSQAAKRHAMTRMCFESQIMQ